MAYTTPPAGDKHLCANNAQFERTRTSLRHDVLVAVVPFWELLVLRFSDTHEVLDLANRIPFRAGSVAREII